jgi:hypothetical protein
MPHAALSSPSPIAFWAAATHLPPAFAFGEAALLWGAAAAAGPVIIHLLMRTRTRTVTFPAVRFVLAGRAANVNRLRLKHLLLLLLRALAIMILAAALAWPGCESAGEVEPTAAVFVLDNSPSTEYRHDGRTLLETAKRRAAEIAAALPPGSEVAVIDLARGAAPPTWRPLPVSEDAFAGIRPGRNTGPIAPAAARALEALTDHRFNRKVAYVLTDRTAHPWRDPIILRPGRAGVAVVLVDCSVPAPAGGGFPDRNYAVPPPLVERDPITPGEALAVQVSVRAAAGRAPVRASLLIDGVPGTPASAEFVFRDRVEPEPAAPDGAQRGPIDIRTIRLTRTGLTPGVYTGWVVLEGDDRLSADDTAYFQFTVSAPFKLVFVYEPAAGGESAEGRPHIYLAEMIEPRERRLRGVNQADVKVFAADRDWPTALSDAAMLVMLNVPQLASPRREAVDRFVRSGGRLWWVCGDRTEADWVNEKSPVGLMPGRIAGGPAAATGPLTPAHPQAPALRAFGARGAGELERTEIRRMWAVEPRDRDTEVWATADSGGKPLPAILHRKVERGRVLMWAFPPARSWSNMQDFVPEWPVLVQETITELMGRSTARGAGGFRLGDPVRRQTADNLVGREVEWGRLGAGDALNRRCKVERGGLIDFGVPEEPGNYRARLPTATEAVEEDVFSVNLDPAETLMHPQTIEWIRDRFPADVRPNVRMFEPGEPTVSAGVGSEPLAGHLALALLAILAMEAFLANRFYRQDPQETGAPAADRGR